MKYKTSEKTAGLLLIFFLMAVNISMYTTLLYADIVYDPRAQVFEDSTEYGGRGDVNSISIMASDTHLFVQVKYEAPLPDSNAYLRRGDIFINTDNNRSTGYRRMGVGADYRLDFDVLGTGVALADVSPWNSTRGLFIEEIEVATEIESDSIMLQVPLSLLGINDEISIDFFALFKTQIRDWINDVYTYVLEGNDNITLDGNIDDWNGIPPIISEQVEEYEEQSDFTEFFTTDNSTHLFHRFEVTGEMPFVSSDDIIHSGMFRIYYDTDNNSATGYSQYGIGAEFLYLINTERLPSGEQTSTYGYLHAWDEENQMWDWPNKTRLTSVYINSTFEFSVPLFEDGLNIENKMMRILVAEYDSELLDSVPYNGFLSNIPPFIEITDSYVADNRVDIGSIQQIYFHARWSTGKNMTTGILYVNGTAHDVNNTGWISFGVTSYEVASKNWTISGVSALGIDKYNQTTPDPSIVWDEVVVVIPKSLRIDLGSDFPLKYVRYKYDGTTFLGSVSLNDTLADKKVGRYGYRVIEIIDSNYNLTAFDSRDFHIIIDKVKLNLSLSDTRVDTWTTPKITVSGYYEYDPKPFEGNITVIQPEHLLKVKEYIYHVSNISDSYGITVFDSNNVTCIWDLLQITDSGVSNHESTIGETEEVWYKVMYEYDDEIFDGEDGVLYVEWEPCEWDEENQRWSKIVSSERAGAKTYYVSKINDYKYGLTQFHENVDAPIINWKEKSWEISGYPHESILLGLMIVLLVLFARRHYDLNL